MSFLLCQGHPVQLSYNDLVWIFFCARDILDNELVWRYILDEDTEDTEDADEDRSSFHSRTTMFVEVRKSHYSEAKTPQARKMTSLVELVLLTVSLFLQKYNGQLN